MQHSTHVLNKTSEAYSAEQVLLNSCKKLCLIDRQLCMTSTHIVEKLFINQNCLKLKPEL